MAANIEAETTAQIMITNPDETLLSPGTKANRQLKSTAVRITFITTRFFFATGIMIAMNMP